MPLLMKPRNGTPGLVCLLWQGRPLLPSAYLRRCNAWPWRDPRVTCVTPGWDGGGLEAGRQRPLRRRRVRSGQTRKGTAWSPNPSRLRQGHRGGGGLQLPLPPPQQRASRFPAWGRRWSATPGRWRPNRPTSCCTATVPRRYCGCTAARKLPRSRVGAPKI